MNLKKTFLALSLLCVAGTSHATLIQNGNGTFTDTATGYQWQNISTFWGIDTSQMSTLLDPGFHFASFGELSTLQAAAPAVPSNFFSDAAAMGTPQPTPLDRDIIWGVYGDLTNWSWKYGFDTNWNIGPTSVTSFADMGAFAVNVSPIPEPEIYAMMAAGLGLMGFVARRRKQKESAAV